MDEKGLKKLLELISILVKMKSEEHNKNIQGFNDRLLVAKEIYRRNENSNEFIKELKKSINDSNEEVYETIITK